MLNVSRVAVSLLALSHWEFHCADRLDESASGC